MDEEQDLEGIWIVDPVLQTRMAAFEYHYLAHGAQVGAAGPEQYLQKAIAFAQERKGRGRPVSGLTDGVRRWSKQRPPCYIELTPDGEIVSFGSIK